MEWEDFWREDLCLMNGGKGEVGVQDLQLEEAEDRVDVYAIRQDMLECE